jgi:hypothetical protein
MIQGSPVNLLDYGADPTGTNDCSAALTAAIAASNNIYIPAGTYKFTSTFTVTGSRGLIIQGESTALTATDTDFAKCTILDFSSIATSTNGLVFTDFVGLTLKNFKVKLIRPSAGSALYLFAGHDYSLDHIDVDIDAGALGVGIKFGNGDGATSTFIGNIKNCKVIANGGTAFFADFGTSLTFESCYAISGAMSFKGMSYSSVISCGVDVAPSHGYTIEGCVNMVFDACGVEQAGKSGFYLSTTTSNIIFNAPYGAANNTTNDVISTDLIYLDSSAGAVNSITINNPTAVATSVGTTYNIFGTASTGLVEIYNTDVTLLPLGINGNATWKANNLTITGYWSKVAWTPTLVSWTNVGSPTLEANYIKSGRVITFYVKITPATSISSTKGSSRITGLPFGTVLAGSAAMLDGNTTSFGDCIVDATGTIYMQTSGVLTVPITLVGTLILN